jgi:hypothetical protein
VGATARLEAQPEWDAHAAFIDELFERGTIVMGGAFTDNSGSLVLFEGIDESEVRRLMETDPFVVNGVFVVDDVREWTIYVDALTLQ